MLIPELLLVAATVLLATYGIRRGLAGIGVVRDELAQRSQADLSPLPLAQVPEELRPLLEETNELLERLALSLEAHRHLVADASHQLRTPIAALQAEAEAALRSPNPKEALERIVAATRRLAHLAHQLLMLNRFEPGKVPALQEIDLAALLGAAAERWMPLANRKGIDLGFELAAAPVAGVPLWIEELANNLVDNALRHTSAQGVVTVRCGSDPAAGWMEVEDSGPGIPVEERERVFDRFYRLQENDGEGCGLGLAIVREVARVHGAAVTIDSGPIHGGARVTVRFPRRITA
jgi:two-component system sensor histidine kinase TctE